jgi:hypothetical protein
VLPDVLVVQSVQKCMHAKSTFSDTQRPT